MRNTDLKKDRLKILLPYIEENPGSTAADTAAYLAIGSADTVRRLLDDCAAEGLVTVRNVVVSGKRGKAARGYTLTQTGVELLHPPEDPAPQDDWSAVPSLSSQEEGGDAAAVPAVATAAPVAEMPEPPSQKAGEGDMDAICEALRTLRAMDTGVADLDFDITALAAKMERAMAERIAPCPHCGSRMDTVTMGAMKGLRCTGCGLAVTYGKGSNDLGTLICKWNRRV